MANISDGNAFVAGRDVTRVRRLLALASELDFDPRVVQTRTNGYEVPQKVADAYEAELAEASKPKAAAKAAPKTSAKTTAKGTRTKKAASASSDQKE